MDAEMVTDELLEAPPPPPPPPAPVKRTIAPARLPEAEMATLREMFEALGGQPSFRLRLERKDPKLGPNGENLAGILETVEEVIDEDWIRRKYGGGKYQIIAHAPDTKGVYRYAKAATIQIAGEPKLPRAAAAEVVMPAAADDGVDRALSTMERQIDRADQQAAALAARLQQSESRALDLAEKLAAPYRLQMEAAQKELSEMRRQLTEAQNRPVPADPFRDRMLDNAFSGAESRVTALTQQYENRINGLREQHQAEVNALRQEARAERTRLEERHADELRRLERQHQQQIDLAKESGAGRVENLKLTHETMMAQARAEAGRLERELQTANARVSSLEAKKDQSLTDKAEELVKVREALDAIGGGKGDGDGEESTIEKVLGTLTNSEAVVSLVNRIGGSKADAAPVASGHPPGALVQNEQGQPFLVDAQGVPQPISPAQAQEIQQRQARLAQLQASRRSRPRRALAAQGRPTAAPAPAALPAPSGVAGAPSLKGRGKEVKLAIQMMETAMRNRVQPAMFARTVQHLVPTDVLAFIRHVGMDRFLDQVLEIGSPLASREGRAFALGVAAALMGNAPPAAAPVAAIAVPAPVATAPEADAEPTTEDLLGLNGLE